MKNLLSVLFAIYVCAQSTNSYRILGVFVYPGKSHWIMQESLMKGLARRGHQVDVVTMFPLKKSEPNYKEISLESSIGTSVTQNNMNATDIRQFMSLSIAWVDILGKMTCEVLDHPKLRDLIQNPPKDPPYDLVITEIFIAPCYLAFSRHLKIPLIGTVTNVFDWLTEVIGNPASLSHVPSMFSTVTQHMTFKERLLNVLMSNYITLQYHYYTNRQLEFVKKHFNINVPHITDLYNDVALYLVNSHHSLHGIRPMSTNVIDVGGLHLTDNDDALSPEVQKWLDESKDGCVYFTFGSMVKIETFPKETIEQFYASFEKIAPVRILMKVAKKEELLPGLPKNVMTQSWFPQKSVLKHKNIRAFITHGGNMGTLEAIYFGIPMIGIPLFGDQKVNIKNYDNKKVAISLEDIKDVTEAKLTSALNTIIKDPSYRSNAQKLSKMFLDRPTSALNTSIFWVEYIAKYGNVLQSPAIRLYWWQRILLDVYAFILLVIILVLSVTLFVLQKVKKLLFGSRASAKKSSAEIKSKKDK